MSRSAPFENRWVRAALATLLSAVTWLTPTPSRAAPVPAEDVKFSLERYRGTSQKTLKDRVAAVETPDPWRVRIRLKQPWPDFMTFYSTATGAGWIVPKKYVEKVGEEGYKKSPVGAGPYRFVSFTPGVELVLEASEVY